MADPWFTFDSGSRLITNLSSGQRWTVCEHLAEPLTALLGQPASIQSVSTSWTRVDLAVGLSRGPSIRPAAPAFLTPPGVTTWANDDSHYSVEFGITCSACRQAISWPQSLK